MRKVDFVGVDFAQSWSCENWSRGVDSVGVDLEGSTHLKEQQRTPKAANDTSILAVVEHTFDAGQSSIDWSNAEVIEHSQFFHQACC